MRAAPPQRAPHYTDNEQYGWDLRQCAINLIATLSNWVSDPVEFTGDANGRIWRVREDDRSGARLFFTSDKGDGVIELSVHESCWVRAELQVGGELKFRAWIDDPYEEKEFWPDGADGVTPPNGDAPGRISKRGRWLQIDCARFPGAAVGENGYWSVEDILY
ncbi:MAG TPA: hypothetical protein VEA80_18510 [Vitreimonas sp.]|uniref:hypothetical protein n=1 Tax=Vitreimonas sp. TaxID=3069702 RepID=UPI002D52F0C0|nr:hypothetical protein [Vitreimonas sp.]HYD89479.1 hypothetical protein [Vitreimonas sp.]